ncbi:unnamed protein product [Heterosigma akashiwo]
MEMLKTADQSLELTLLAKGQRAHHIGQFLPKEELDRFLKKSDAAKEGKALEESDYADKKLDSSNLGFQMLQKAGWKEGEAVGGKKEGLVEPVNMHKPAGEGAGVGVQATHEVDQDDDEFDQYRKRMMLAYRFRPNPMNNPRRAYY